MSLQQLFQAPTGGNWETPSDWVIGQVPTPLDDVAIGAFGDTAALLDNDVTVNSVAVDTGSSLTITDATLVATNGTVTSASDTDVFVTGNLGTITVGQDAALTFGGDFFNAGTLNVQGLSNLDLDGDVDLLGSGTINLFSSLQFTGDVAMSGGGVLNLVADPAALSSPLIGELGNTGVFTNVDDTISGAGEFVAGGFDNQAGGTLVAGSAALADTLFNQLQITAPKISNEGAIDVVATAGLLLQTDGGSGSLVNAGQIDVASEADIAFCANFTLSGAGSVNIDGAGGFVAGATDQTLINKSTIEGFSTQGMLGQNLDNDAFMTLVNQGSVLAVGFGNELTVSTGANVIQDAGGLLEANLFGHLVIDSAVHTGSPGLVGDPLGGTIEATSGGFVTIASSVSDGINAPQFSLPGQIVIGSGTVEFLSGSSDSIPIAFTGGGVLEVHSAATVLGAIQGFAAGDALSVAGKSISSVGIGPGSVDIVTNVGAFDFTDVSFSGAVTGYAAFADPSTAGLERVLFTDGEAGALFETHSTVFQQATETFVNGEGDTIDFQGGGNTTNLGATDGAADVVNGSNGAIDLNSAQARVVGGSDAIAFAGTGAAVSLFATDGHFDAVTGVSGSVFLDGAQTSVDGAGDTIHFESGFAGNKVSLLTAPGLGDVVEGSDGVVDVHATSADVIGGGDAIDFISGASDLATLSNTGSAADLVQGVAATVDLHGATAKATSSGDTFAFTGSNTLGLIGTAEAMAFSHGIGGLDSISGVGSTDTFQFSKADFADFAALQAHTAQSGANTVISLSASDAVTLVGVQASTLAAAQFKFV